MLASSNFNVRLNRLLPACLFCDFFSIKSWILYVINISGNEWNHNLLYNPSPFIHRLSVGTCLRLVPRSGTPTTTWNFWIARCWQQPRTSNLSPYPRWHPLCRFTVLLSPVPAELGKHFYSLFMWKCNAT